MICQRENRRFLMLSASIDQSFLIGRFLNFFKINCTLTVLSKYELSLTKDSHSNYKDHILFGSIKQVFKELLWVTNEYTYRLWAPVYFDSHAQREPHNPRP